MKNVSKRRVEDCLRITVGDMAKANLLSQTTFGTWVWKDENNAISASISYRHEQGFLTLSFNTSTQYQVQNIRISTTPCNYGKHRYWFMCPGNKCGRRIANLYMADNLFLCRHCHKLNYLIQQCNKEHIAKINMQRMRLKLGWPLDREHVPFLLKVHKPLHKHHKKFKAMVEKHDAYEREANAAIAASYNALMNKLDVS